MSFKSSDEYWRCAHIHPMTIRYYHPKIPVKHNKLQEENGVYALK